VVGWVFFRAKSAAQAFSFIAAMFGMGPHPTIAPLMRGELLPNRSLVMIVLGLAFVAVRAIFGKPRPESGWRWVFVSFAPILFVLALLQVVNTKFIPLIYFKF